MTAADQARAVPGGVQLDVRLTPRGGRDSLDGFSTLSDGRVVLAARVRAVPEAGAANAALARLVADALDVPKSTVSVVSGHTARLKTLKIEGEAAELMRRLAMLRD